MSLATIVPGERHIWEILVDELVVLFFQFSQFPTFIHQFLVVVGEHGTGGEKIVYSSRL